MSTTTIMQRSDLLIFTIVINLIIVLYMKSHASKGDYSSRLFTRIIISIALLSSFELITWLSSLEGAKSLVTIRYWSNFFFLALTSMPAALGLSYLDFKIFGDEKSSKKRVFVYLIPTFIAILSAIYNLFKDGFLFSVSADNIYSRGLAVYFNLGFMYVFFLAALFVFFRKRKMITGRTVSSILIFFFLPILGSLAQSIFYGTTFGMASYTMAAFIVFLILEKDEMGKDELTGLYTRQKMESRLRYKIKNNDPFIVVMADMDGFKAINDNYGHSEGDNALKMAATILQKSINLEDMVCRYGGDEFLILIESEDDVSDMVMKRIDRAFERFNNDTPYHIGLSYGFEFVANPETQNLDELLDRIDKRMYVIKESKKDSDVTKS